MVLLNLHSGSYYGLNNIGACFVRGLEKQVPVEQTISAIAEQFDVDSAVVNQDIQHLIEQLLEQKLLTETLLDSACQST